MSTLIEGLHLEDASELVLSTQPLACAFLTGTWVNDSYYFSMESDGDIHYNLPRAKYGSDYKIEDGTVLFYPKNNENSAKAAFKITAISSDHIEIFCYKDNNTYTLYRK